MFNDVLLNGETYLNVPAVHVPTLGGVSVTFADVSDTTASAEDVETGTCIVGSDMQVLSGSYIESENLASYIKRFTDVSSFYDASISYIKGLTFGQMYGLKEVSMPAVESIGSGAFYFARTLSSVNLPKCGGVIPRLAFYWCSSVQSLVLDFSNITSIGEYAFEGCYTLSTFFNCPKVSYIGQRAFYSCSRIKGASFSEATYIDDSAFYMCSRMSIANFPEANYIGSSAFMNCYLLTTLSFPKAIDISRSAFYHINKSANLYFLGSVIPTLYDNFLSSCCSPSTYHNNFVSFLGSIYVKASMLSAFQTAQYWSIYSSQMVGLTDAQIAELDVQ